MKEDEKAYQDIVAAIIDQCNDGKQSEDSSMLRDERSVSHYKFVLRQETLKSAYNEKQKAEGTREIYLQNLQGSFQSANSSSIASWGESSSVSGREGNEQAAGKVKRARNRLADISSSSSSLRTESLGESDAKSVQPAAQPFG